MRLRSLVVAGWARAPLFARPASQLAREACIRGAIQWPAELAALLALLRRRRPRTILEIGTARGGTLWAFTRVAAPDALLVSIDLPGGAFGGGYSDEDMQRYASFARRRQSLRFLRADSQDAATRAALLEILGGRPLDFLFIDGDHSYEGVRADYESYAPLVRPGGLIALHDIVEHRAMPECQVDRLWAEIAPTHRSSEFVASAGAADAWGGIGVLYV